MRVFLLLLAFCVCLSAVSVEGRRSTHHHRRAPAPTPAAPTWTPSTFTQAMIMDVSFVDLKNGYIVGGDNGVGSNALRSEDGGVSWTEVPIHQPELMIAAVAASSIDSAILTGVALGGGAAQYTNNGSAFTNSSEGAVSVQTTQSAQVVTGSVYDFAITGQFDFWGSNETYNAVGFSEDGGATFDFSVITDLKDVPARYGAFPAQGVAFVSGGTWPHVTAEKPGRAITRNIRAHHSKASASLRFDLDHDVERESADAGGIWSGVIYRTTDYKTWEQVYSNSSFYFNQIACASADVCFAVAENDATGYGFRTTDGGDTWEEVLAVNGVSMMSAHVVAGTQEVWLGGGVLAQSGMIGHLYHSVDGGATFSLTTLDNYYLTGLSFIDATHGWATAMNADSACNVLIYA